MSGRHMHRLPILTLHHRLNDHKSQVEAWSGGGACAPADGHKPSQAAGKQAAFHEGCRRQQGSGRAAEDAAQRLARGKVHRLGARGRGAQQRVGGRGQQRRCAVAQAQVPRRGRRARRHLPGAWPRELPRHGRNAMSLLCPAARGRQHQAARMRRCSSGHVCPAALLRAAAAAHTAASIEAPNVCALGSHGRAALDTRVTK